MHEPPLAPPSEQQSSRDDLDANLLSVAAKMPSPDAALAVLSSQDFLRPTAGFESRFSAVWNSLDSEEERLVLLRELHRCLADKSGNLAQKSDNEQVRALIFPDSDQVFTQDLVKPIEPNASYSDQIVGTVQKRLRLFKQYSELKLDPNKFFETMRDLYDDIVFDPGSKTFAAKIKGDYLSTKRAILDQSAKLPESEQQLFFGALADYMLNLLEPESQQTQVVSPYTEFFDTVFIQEKPTMVQETVGTETEGGDSAVATLSEIKSKLKWLAFATNDLVNLYPALEKIKGRHKIFFAVDPLTAEAYLQRVFTRLVSLQSRSVSTELPLSVVASAIELEKSGEFVLGARSEKFTGPNGVMQEVIQKIDQAYAELRAFEFCPKIEYTTTITEALQSMKELREYGRNKQVVLELLARFEVEGMPRAQSVEILDLLDSMRAGWQISGIVVQEISQKLSGDTNYVAKMESLFRVAPSKDATVRWLEENNVNGFAKTQTIEALSGNSIENTIQTMLLVVRRHCTAEAYQTIKQSCLNFAYEYKAQASLKNGSDVLSLEEFRARLSERVLALQERDLAGEHDADDAVVLEKHLSSLKETLQSSLLTEWLYSEVTSDDSVIAEAVIAHSLPSEKSKYAVEILSNGDKALKIELDITSNLPHELANYIRCRTMQPTISCNILVRDAEMIKKFEKILASEEGGIVGITDVLSKNLTTWLEEKPLLIWHGWGASAVVSAHTARPALLRLPPKTMVVSFNWMGSTGTNLTSASEWSSQNSNSQPIRTATSTHVSGSEPGKSPDRSLATYAAGMFPVAQRLFGSVSGQPHNAGHSMGGRHMIEAALAELAPASVEQTDDLVVQKQRKIYEELRQMCSRSADDSLLVALEPVADGGPNAIGLLHASEQNEFDAKVAGIMVQLLTGRILPEGFVNILANASARAQLVKIFFSRLVPNCPPEISNAHVEQILNHLQDFVVFVTQMLEEIKTLTPSEVEHLSKIPRFKAIVALRDRVLPPKGVVELFLGAAVSKEVYEVMSKKVLLLGENSNFAESATHYAHAMPVFLAVVMQHLFEDLK